MNPPTEEQKLMAVVIADGAMLELLRTNTVNTDHPFLFALSGPDGEEVALIEDADPPTQEAFAWLQGRGLAELRADGHGQLIAIVVDGPGSDLVAACITCGCHDLRACCDEASDLPCAWVRLDRELGTGVCSACGVNAVAEWDAGKRRPGLVTD